MNTAMWEHPLTAQQVAQLKAFGYVEIPCVSKKLVCGDQGRLLWCSGSLAHCDLRQSCFLSSALSSRNESLSLRLARLKRDSMCEVSGGAPGNRILLMEGLLGLSWAVLEGIDMVAQAELDLCFSALGCGQSAQGRSAW